MERTFENLRLLDRQRSAFPQDGMLVVRDGALEFQSTGAPHLVPKGGTLGMPHVHAVSCSNGTLDVKYGDPPTIATAHFEDLSTVSTHFPWSQRWTGWWTWGLTWPFHWRRQHLIREANAQLQDELRSVVALEELSEQDTARVEQAQDVGQQAALKNTKGQAVGRIVFGGVVAAAGAIATAVSQSNADPGDSYTIWWGAIALGAFWMIVGVVQLIVAVGKSAPARGGAGTSAETNHVAAADEEPAQTIEEQSEPPVGYPG